MARVFVSFELEDRWARDFLRQHARNERIDFDFTDYSVKEPFESKWKTNVRERIARTRGTIVLVGATTSRSEAVLWEIQETKRQGKPLFGVQISSSHTYPVPRGITRTTRWDFAKMKAELDSW